MAHAESSSTEQITLTNDNTLVLNSAFSGKSVAGLIQQAKKLDADLKSGYPIYLFLDTPGGGIQAGLELVEYLNGLNRPIHTVTLFAASMGWQLLQHLGTRYVLKYGQLMSHKARGGFSGEFGGGSSQIDSRYTFYLRRLQLMDQQTVDRTNKKKTLKQYQSEYDNELWLNGAEAVKHGYADKVATIKCDKGLVGTTEKNLRFFGFNIKLKFDKCPIVTYPVDIQINVRTNKGYMNLDKFMAEGGRFGKYCADRGREEKRDWNGKLTAPSAAPELCLMDKKLKLEDIDKAIADEKEARRSKKRNIIRMSFGSFIQEL
tara:strand:+ start:20981 stop:21931 length:951 start_codon:yes stop_codon:yes gene_type:complete